jgi:hypothetical protein
MKKLFFIGLLLGASLSGNTQFMLPIQHDTLVHKQEVLFFGLADYGSTSLQNEFTKKLLYGGTITQTIKDNSLAEHGYTNRFGTEVTSEIEYRNYSVNIGREGKYGFLIKGGTSLQYATRYAQDAFQLLFYGNAGFQGDTAVLSGTSYFGMTSTKLGFGLINKKTKSNLSFNVYGIQDRTTGAIWNGVIAQSVAIDSLKIGLNAGYSALLGNGYFKGMGMGVDFDLRVESSIRDGVTNTFQFLARNIGVGYAQQNKTIKVDSVYAYSGLTLDQLLGQPANYSVDGVMDSLGVTEQVGKKWFALPGFIQLAKIVQENTVQKVQSFYGVRLNMLSASAPMAYVGVDVKPMKQLHVAGNVSFGGYSDFRFGCYSQWQLKNLSLGFATEDLYGLFSAKGKGESFVMRLRWCI